MPLYDVGVTVEPRIVYDGEVTDWHDRVIRWPTLRRDILDGLSNISSFTIELADTDLELYGSFNASAPYNKSFSILTYLLQYDPDQGTSVSQFATQYMGRVTELEYRDNLIALTVRDNLDRIQDARFILDYTNLSITAAGATYGTVTGVEGNTIWFDDIGAYKLRRVTQFNDPDIFVLYVAQVPSWLYYGFAVTNYEAFLYLRDIMNDDIISSGAILKFSPTNYASEDARDYLVDTIGYRVSSGTIMGGTAGTLILEDPTPQVETGNYMYVQRPLVFSGNPGNVIYALLTGTNTSVGFTNADIDMDKWGTGTAHTAQYLVSKKITDESPGGVLNEIEALNREINALSYFNEGGTFVWDAYAPFEYPDKTTLPEFGTFTFPKSAYMKSIDDVITHLKLSYGYQYYEPSNEERIYTKTIEGSNTGGLYNSLNKYKSQSCTWIHNDELAKVILRRTLLKHKDPVGEFTLQGPLSHATRHVGEDIVITHREGQLSEDYFQLFSKDVFLDRSSITLSFLNSDEYYGGKGYGQVEDSTGVVYCDSDSKAAWGWYSGYDAQLTKLFDVGDTTLYCDWQGFSVGNYLVVEDEIVWVSAIVEITPSAGTYTVQRAKLTTAQARHLSAEYIKGYAGTPSPVFDHDTYIGTVYNINTTTYGTIFKWW